MLKPIIFEVAVMFVAAVSYLYHREFADQTPTQAELVDVSRAAATDPVQAAVPELQTVQAWVVPGSAVLHSGGQDYVFAQKSAGGHFQRVPVQGHLLADGRYAITGGLDARQPVAVAGVGALNRLSGR